MDYFGVYHNFDTESKKAAATLLTADNLVGDIYAIEDELVGGEHIAWMVSRFGMRVGFFDANFSRELAVMQAQGMTLKAILSYVAYTEDDAEGHYWGQAAVICYSENPSIKDACDNFVQGIAAKISEGVRPVISLDQASFEKIIESDGAWIPSQNTALPDTVKGTRILKQRRGILDKTIEQGRSGNKGCYVASWAFLLAVVTLVVWGIYKLFA